MITTSTIGKTTIFKQLVYPTNDCSGLPYSNSGGGSEYDRNPELQYSNTSTVCMSSGQPAPMRFVTAMLAPVVAMSSGVGIL